MNIVLLSGGSGKRLWPLSNDMQSKQFLKLLKNNHEEYESMVQRVVRQLKTAHADASIFVSCNAAQDEMLRKQLGMIETICEPARRDTFPAIVLAAAYLRHRKQMSNEDVFIVCPIDPCAECKYFELFTEMENLVKSKGFNIGLMGAIPTYPSEKYGYIIQRDSRVTGFVEKPNKSQAEVLIANGALWNCGAFALKIGYVLHLAEKLVEFDSFEALYDQYDKLPSTSFDYQVVEKEQSIGAVVYDGKWKDLGTWNTLTEEMESNLVGKNVLISGGSVNTHVLNMLSIPVIVQDISDAVVVASYDGILVSSKYGSSFIKPLAEQIEWRPMYEQRSWGNYRVLEYKNDDKVSSLVKKVKIDAGKTNGENYCSDCWLIWIILSGKGLLTTMGGNSVVSEGDVINLLPGSEYSLSASESIELIEIAKGAL